MYPRSMVCKYIIVNALHKDDNKDDDDDDDDDNNNNNNNTSSTNCKYRTAASLCTLETWFVSGI